MRENFSKRIKENLAKRVAYKCSFPGCTAVTIGAGHKSAEDVINLGEAAHICAASPNGPRYNPNMSTEERTSIDNGIWMCRIHAKLIDADYYNYSSATIKQWKLIAEEKAKDILVNGNQANTAIPTTLISIGRNIVFEGIWVSAFDITWEFEVKNFIIGSIELLKGFNDDVGLESLRYIVIESQGDGRFIAGKLNWKYENGIYRISLNPKEKSPRTTPYHLAGIPWNFELENGSLKIVKGIAYAKQMIAVNLSIGLGELYFQPEVGSFISTYYWKFKNNHYLLTRLLKLEITRLISIPNIDNIKERNTPPLSFINRILALECPELKLKENNLTIHLMLEWGDGKTWEDSLDVYINKIE